MQSGTVFSRFNGLPFRAKPLKRLQFAHSHFYTGLKPIGIYTSFGFKKLVRS
jgi:hypothetical protein